ncbi:sulfate transporter [Klebsiella sp. STW0522-44]|nr:sulfate transporter [Klebsiella sp. STW0522-44]
MNTEINVPEGYRTNAQGHLVPVSQVKPLDLLRDETVMKIVHAAKVLRQAMAEFKITSMQNISDFTDLSASEYGVEFGGAKGNVSLVSFDGRYKLLRAVGEHRVFDERIQAAKNLIDTCIREWSGGADEKIMALVDHAFRVNKQGRIDINQVLGLRSLNIDDPKWNEAMDAAADAIQVTGTSQYLRLYERQDDGSYQQISLDIAKI